MRGLFLVASWLLSTGINAQPWGGQVVSETVSPDVSALVYPSPNEKPIVAAPNDAPYWLADIAHQGIAAFNQDPSGYKVFRNVKDYGARGDGQTDDTAAINRAISDGNRASPESRRTSSTTPAIVYFPPGTYMISKSIIDYYFTQLIGNPNSRPVIKATPDFKGLGLIDGDQYQNDGKQGWTSTVVFFRQIRNLVLDMTGVPPGTGATGIHWPTGQASSLYNIKIIMKPDPGSKQQGLFIENGSGSVIDNIEIIGGLYGANIGNQQYTTRNLTISDAQTCISQIWNWGWTYQDITLRNCGTAISMVNGGPGSQTVGSVIVLDSNIRNCRVFVDTVWQESTWSNGSLILENVSLDNVPVAVQASNNTVLEGSTESTKIETWGQGHRYTPSGPDNFQGALGPAQRPRSLLARDSSRYYAKSKPQYEREPISSFVSVRQAGAKGDGSTDDTSALQSALDTAARDRKIVFFDQGVYKITRILVFPPGSRVVGEAFPVIMASGQTWSNIEKPVPVIQVGKPGDTGFIEWSDMLVSTQGSTPGAVLIEWNLAGDEGSGMWEVHTRIGGFAGSQLQVPECPTDAEISPRCEAAYMSMHITSSASNVYLENVWLWTADHDLDDGHDTRISVYTGRGLLVEGKNVWLYGTCAEHHSLYQYQLVNTESVLIGFIQSESPYYQPNPDAAHGPYHRNTTIHDPDYTTCLPGNCNSLGLRLLDTHDTLIYGAGLYSFFNNYNTSCSATSSPVDCQSEVFNVDGRADGLVIYALSTVGTENMLVRDERSLATAGDNRATFADTIAYFSL